MEILLNILEFVLYAVVILSMVALIIVVLLQNDKSGGLGILGGGASQTGFGNRKAEPIVRITQILGALFMIGSFALAFVISKPFDSGIDDKNTQIEENTTEGNTTTQPEGEVTTQPESETTKQPEGEVTTQPESETTKQPEGEVTTQPESETTTQPEGEVTTQPESETTKQPEGETTGSPNN